MSNKAIQDVDKQLRAAQRLQAVTRAKDDLLTYMKLRFPEPEALDDPERSRYEVTPQARLLCQIVEKMDRGELKRVAVSIGPQLGKSEILSRSAPAWLSGRNPFRNIMLGTYNQTFADEFGSEVKTIIQSDVHRSVFPNHNLDKQRNDFLTTTPQQGKLAFVGVGGSGTGKPADFFMVDDPIRNDDDAQSQLYRDRLWKWFNSVVFTRTHGKSGIIVVHTRWHQDDLIGRLCDPDHPERDKEYKGIAHNWTYINLPAVVEDPKQAKALGLTLEEPKNPDVVSMFGTKPMSALWPERKPLEFLAEAKRMDPRTFGALYMGQPAPEDGEFFKMNMIVEYDPHELPENLVKYGASDHALSTKTGRDYTVLGCAGVDENDDIWILPDVVFSRIETDRTVEEMISQMKRHQPAAWWMESENISKSFGPFLKKRQAETQTYTPVIPVNPHKTDKELRARAIQGRMMMRKVRFPRFAPWWPDAKAQLLKFPFGAHDDFVDFLSYFGLGMLGMVNADPITSEKPGHQTGSIQWILRNTRKRAQEDKRRASNAGW